VPFISELHTFTTSVGTKLVQEDRVVVYEAIAHVISAMPMDQAAQSLKTFASTILAAVFAVASKPGVATKQELQEVGSAFACYLLVTTHLCRISPKKQMAWPI
jgi:transportin-3